jgi:hypothetical protein
VKQQRGKEWEKTEVRLKKGEIPIQRDENLQNTGRDAVTLAKKNRQCGFILLEQRKNVQVTPWESRPSSHHINCS